MKKILRLVTTSVLTLTLVACGEASATSSTNSGTTSNVTSVSSAYANVTSVNLSAASNLLTQTLGTPRTVTVTAVLNANTNPNLAVEWFVNGVKQQQTGRVLDYTPTAAGAFAVTARVGNVSSNVLTVNVGLPTINITKTEFVTSRQLALTADAGANVTVVGAKLEDSSYFDLKTGRYILNFESPVEQGTNLTVRLERPGFGVKVEQVLFDTRQFSVDTVELVAGSGLTLVNGVYQVTRPYDAGSQYAKLIEVSFKQKNILSTLKSQEFKVTTGVPTGSTAVAPSSTLITELGTQQVTINSTTALGLYTFTYELGGKSQVVRLQVNEPKPEIVLSEAYDDVEYFNEDGELIKFGVAVVDALHGSGTEEVVLMDSTGAFVVEKPFASTDNTKTLKVDFIARNFATDEFINNQWSVNLFGPSVNAVGRTQLFAGIELNSTNAQGLNNTNLTTDNTFKDFTGTLLSTGGALRTSGNGTIVQQFDRGTPVGEYTFTVSAGLPGKEITQNFVVKIVEPTPELRFDMTQANSTNSTTSVQRNYNPGGLNNTYVIEKPFDPAVSVDIEWFATLLNYQSALETDLTKVSEEVIKQDLSTRTLFNFATDIKNSTVTDADFLVGINTTNNVIQIKPENLTSVNVLTYMVVRVGSLPTGINSGAKIFSSTFAPINLSDTNGFIVIDQDLDLDNRPVSGDAVTYEVIFNPTTTDTNGEIDVANAATEDSELPAPDATLVVKATNYPNVLELGAGVLQNTNNALYGSNQAMYKFVNVGMTVAGPSSLIAPIPQTKAAILLAEDDYALSLVEATSNSTDLSSYLGSLSGDLDSSIATYGDLRFADNSGFRRSNLVIDSTTVAGTYTLTFSVDNLEEVVTLVIRNPQPKLFVLSANVLANSGLLPNKPSSVIAAATGVNTNALTTFATEGALYNKIKFKDAGGTFSATYGSAFDPSDLFASEINGVYTIEMPAANLVSPTDLNFGLYSEVAVADMVKGTYNYSISKSYPSGRQETFSDTVTIVNVENNQVAAFDSNNTKFLTNFVIKEPTLELGQYVYEFSVGAVSRRIVINVVEMPSLVVEKLSVGTSIATFYEGYHLVPTPSVTPDADSPVRVLIDVSKFGITDENYFVVTSLTDTGLVVDDPIELNVLTSLDGVLLLDVGSIDEAIAINDYVELTIKFYKKVSYVDYLISLGYTTNAAFIAANITTNVGYIQIGETQTISILVYEPAAPSA